MSKTKHITITCPSCQKESDFQIWESINTVLDPDLKAAVRDRSAFLFTCPYCSAETHVDYGFLYHQMEDRIMIHYVTSDEEAEEIGSLLNGEKMPDMIKEMLQKNYLIRIVRSQNQLREKLMIFDAGLDDRIIELIKVFVLAKYHEDHSGADEKTELLYYTEKGRHILQLFADDKPAGSAEFSMQQYEELKSDFGSRMPDIRKDKSVIDLNWALEIMG